MNTSEFLNIATLIVPERTAIVFDGKRITYARLSDRVNRLSNALAKMGVSEGDRIAMMQVNCNEHIEAYFAAAKLDAVYVPLNFRSSSEEIRYMLRDASPKAIFAGKRYTETIDGIIDDIEGLDIRIVIDGPIYSFCITFAGKYCLG
jgi:acyl-CoA synthetase (AMP-forming)/AMP-acid ligase II